MNFFLSELYKQNQLNLTQLASYEEKGNQLINDYGLSREWINYLNEAAKPFNLKHNSLIGYLFSNYNLENLSDLSLMLERINNLTNLIINYESATTHKIVLTDLAGQRDYDSTADTFISQATKGVITISANLIDIDRMEEQLKKVTSIGLKDLMVLLTFLDKQDYNEIHPEDIITIIKELQPEANIFGVQLSSARPIYGFYNSTLELLILKQIMDNQLPSIAMIWGPGGNGKTQNITINKFIHDQEKKDWIHNKKTYAHNHVNLIIYKEMFKTGWMGPQQKNILEKSELYNIDLIARVAAGVRPSVFGIPLTQSYPDKDKIFIPTKNNLEQRKKEWLNYVNNTINKLNKVSDLWNYYGLSTDFIKENKKNLSIMLQDALSINEDLAAKILERLKL